MTKARPDSATGLTSDAARRPKPTPNATGPIAASDVLQQLHDQAPADHFTLGWLLGRPHKRSFGIIMLLLAVVAIAPGASIVAGVLLMIPAFQMIAGQAAPVFPRRIAAHPLPTQHLAALVQRAVPVLRYLEKVIHPGWPTPFEPTKRLIGAVVLILRHAGRGHRADGRVGGDLGDDPRRQMDHWPVVGDPFTGRSRRSDGRRGVRAGICR